MGDKKCKIYEIYYYTKINVYNVQKFKNNKDKRGANFKKRICSFLSQSGKF